MSSQPSRVVRWLALLAVIVVCAWARCGDRAHLFQPSGVLIHDLDTLRRLVRLGALDRAESYPIVERNDGCPDGSTLHWTLPMDWVIRAVDPIARPFVANARPYEAGAIVAGPCLATLAIAILALLLARTLGFWPALLASALYGLAYSCVNTSRLGNGDHQTLQQLLLACAVPSLLCAALPGSARARAWALASGFAVGAAVWVSTEMMLAFYVIGGALALAAMWRPADSSARALAWPWSVGVVVAVAIGHLFEHPGALAAFQWDSVSWFQLWQVAVFALFAAIAARRASVTTARVAVAAVCALGAGLLPLASGAVRDALADQLRAAGAANVWLAADVSEFRSLFQFGYGALFDREGWIALALPPALVGLWWSPLAHASRSLLAIGVLAAFSLYVWEVKLGHLFALFLPISVVAGYLGWAQRERALAAIPMCRAAAAVALVNALWHLPAERAPLLRHNDLMVREICAKVQQARAALPADADAGVLAPWDMGAPLMHHAGVGVVASGYHRNLEGIRDGFRFWLSDLGELAQAMDLLRRRRVRYVVAWYDRSFFLSGARTIGKAPLRTERELLPAAARTVFMKLRFDSLPGFRLLAEGPEIQLPGSPRPEPLYRLFEVTAPR